VAAEEEAVVVAVEAAEIKSVHSIVATDSLLNR
jgi:hypothetical protein